MGNVVRFLVIDGYPKVSRDDLKTAGMQLAWKLYGDMVQRNLPEAEYDVLLPSDPGVEMPTEGELEKYSGILWTGCNLCIFDDDNPSVTKQLELAKLCYEIGIPSFGSCWGLQISVVAAGGKVVPNPRGKEMGIARKIKLSNEGLVHPMMKDKPPVYEAYISHDDMVSEIPEGAVILAGNDFTPVQALAVTHQKGTFWSVQYHPEYNLHEMACLIIAREEKLIDGGFFKHPDELKNMVDKMKILFKEPHRKDLRWQLVIDDDVLSSEIKECEIRNWISELVLPYSAQKKWSITMNNTISKFSFPTAIYFGAGAIEELPQYLKDIGIKKPLLVTDPGMLKTDVFPRVEGVLKDAGVAFGLFAKVNPNPLDSDIQKAVDIYEAEECDGLIGLGGGSALDASKMVQVIAGHGGKVNDYDISTGGNQNIVGPLPPMIAIPTTSGTGSEVGSCSVITSVELGRKFLVCSPLLIPAIALLDPELTAGMPASLTAGTAMDAFTHCLEALSVKDFHPMCDAIALKGIEYVADYLETAVKEPDNIEARGYMQLAAMMGAVAFQKDLGAAHSLSHSLSAVSHVPHGLANAICLVPVMKFNKESCLEEYAKVAACFGVNTFEMSIEEAAEKGIEAVIELKKRIGIPERLSDVGVKESDLEELTEKAFLDGCHQSNPRPCTKDDLKDLYRQVL